MSKWDVASQAISAPGGFFAGPFKALFITLLTLALGSALGAGCARSAPPLYDALTIAPGSSLDAPLPEVSEPLRVISDIPSPRALAYDAARDELLVGVRVGETSSGDREVFIMRFDGEGRLLDPRYLEFESEGEPLRDLRGLALSEDALYLLESRRLLIFNRASGELLRAIEIEGARALHAIALDPSGAAYLVDRGLSLGERGFIPEESDAVYRVDPAGDVRILAEDGLWIVSFGSGALFRLSDEGEIVDRRTLSAGSLDGLLSLSDGRLIIASWEARAILIGEKRGDIEPEIHGVDGPAAIAIDEARGRLYVALPLMNELRVFRLKLHEAPREASGVQPEASD